MFCISSRSMKKWHLPGVIACCLLSFPLSHVHASVSMPRAFQRPLRLIAQSLEHFEGFVATKNNFGEEY